MEVRGADDFEGALEAAKTRVEAGILLSSPLMFVYSKQIGELALAKRLPTTLNQPGSVVEGRGQRRRIVSIRRRGFRQLVAT